MAMTLREGHSGSCGCQRGVAGAAHSRHPLYSCWINMMGRCYKPHYRGYENYGLRGIKVCEQWKVFGTFRQMIEDSIGLKPDAAATLDRIRVEDGYQPGNVRWASRREQALNRRNTRWVEWNGRSRRLADLAREHRLLVDQVDSRLKGGWTLERALTEPLGSNGRARRALREAA